MAVEVASEKYKKLKAEVSRLASMVNKRLERLERNELTDLPAYQTWYRNGHIRFGVKGKSYQELQSEFWRLKNFIDDKTSTVRSANRYLREMAASTGIKYRTLADLKLKAKKFFELAERIKQYYQAVNESARALDYQKIWENINTQVQRKKIDLRSATSIDDMLDTYLKAMEELTPVERMQEGYREASETWDFIDI